MGIRQFDQKSASGSAALGTVFVVQLSLLGSQCKLRSPTIHGLEEACDDLNLTFFFQSSTSFRLNTVHSNNCKMDVTLRVNIYSQTTTAGAT